jgi:hypothetical protein
VLFVGDVTALVVFHRVLSCAQSTTRGIVKSRRSSQRSLSRTGRLVRAVAVALELPRLLLLLLLLLL